jgi:hypothetical protein
MQESYREKRKEREREKREKRREKTAFPITLLLSLFSFLCRPTPYFFSGG